MNRSPHGRDAAIQRKANPLLSDERNTTAAAMRKAGLSEAEVEEALFAEIRFKTLEAKEADKNEVEIEFFESQQPRRGTSELFSEQGVDVANLYSSERSAKDANSTSSSLKVKGNDSDSRKQSVGSFAPDSSEKKCPTRSKVETTLRGDYSDKDETDLVPHRLSSSPQSLSADNLNEAKMKSAAAGARPGAFHVEDDPNDFVGMKEEFKSEMANFVAGVRLEREERIQTSLKMEDVSSTRDTDSSKQRNTQSLNKSTNSMNRNDSSHQSMSSLSRSSRTLENLGSSLFSLDQPNLTPRDLHERLLNRPGLDERSDSRRSLIVSMLERTNSQRSSRRGSLSMNESHTIQRRGSLCVSERGTSQRRGSLYLSDREPSQRRGSLSSQRRESLRMRERGPSQRRGSLCMSEKDFVDRVARRDDEYYEQSRNQSSQYVDEEYLNRTDFLAERRSMYEGRGNTPGHRQSKQNGQGYYGYDNDDRRRGSPECYDQPRLDNLTHYGQRRNSPPGPTLRHRQQGRLDYGRPYNHRAGNDSQVSEFRTSQQENRKNVHSRRSSNDGYEREFIRAPGPADNRAQANDPMEFEVSPGVWMKLRGAEETWAAVELGQYAPTICLVCDKKLLVIDDAECVLCPDCRVVSPIVMDEDSGFIDKESKQRKSGIGLGFTVEDLMRWQDEMSRGLNPFRQS